MMPVSPSMAYAQPMPHPHSPYSFSHSRPASPTHSRVSDGLPFRTSPSMSDFEIEKVSKTPAPTSRARRRPAVPPAEDEIAYREGVSRLLVARNRVATISGTIPLDPSHLILFFRTKSGITHSLDFPIDVDYNTPPALDVLIAACRPHQTSDLNDYSDNESLFYPPNLPLTTSLEIANHPILDAIRSALFPLLPQGHYLTVVRDKLEVVDSGGRMGIQSRALRNDGRVATVSVTLPVRFRGGTMIVRDPEGHEEKFYGRGGKTGDMEWVAFSADCEYEVEPVQKGCRLTMFYGIYPKTYGPSGVTEPLINPSDDFLDLLSPVLNFSRGRKIAFNITNDYGVNPSEVLADSLVPILKGGDSLLYHALKVYKLSPELHWTAGGYVWPVDRIVEIIDLSTSSPTSRLSLSNLSIIDTPRGRVPPIRGAFSAYGDEEDVVDDLRSRVVDSGAVSLAEADISVLTDWNTPSPIIGKERVPIVASGELEKLVVNALIVVFVP